MYINSMPHTSLPLSNDWRAGNSAQVQEKSVFSDTVETLAKESQGSVAAAEPPLESEAMSRKREGLQNLMEIMRWRLQEKQFTLENMERRLSGLPPIHRSEFGLSDIHPTMHQALMSNPDLAPTVAVQSDVMPIEHLKVFTEMLSNRLEEDALEIEKMSLLLEELGSTNSVSV